MKKSIILLVSLIFVLTFSFGVFASVFGEHPQFDLGGDTVTIVQPWGTQFEEGEEKAHLEDVESTFNVNIEIRNVPWQDIMDELNASVLAGDPMGDAVNVSHGWMLNYLEDGILRPINEELKSLDFYDRLPEESSDYVKEITTFRGETYGFNNFMDGACRVIIWNKKLFEQEGLANPYELYEAGEWTFDNFKDIAVQATKDTDGDGSIDQWGVASTHDSGGDANMPFETGVYFSYANGGRVYREDEGRIKFGGTEPEYIAGLNFARELINENVWLRNESGGMPDQFLGGNVAMLETYLGDIEGLADEMEDEYGIVLYPKGPDTENNVAIGRGDIFYFVVPIGIDNPEATIEVTSALFEITDPYLDTETYYEDQLEMWSENVWDRESMQMVEEYYANQVTFLISPKTLPGFQGLINSILDGQEDATSALEANQPEAQARIDEIFN